jgi:hypothetical protein
MSTTDDARLEALDRRGRAAAATLLHDLATRGAPALVAEDARTVAEPTVIYADRPTVRRRGRPAHRSLLAAAVVGALVVAGGAVAIMTSDDDPRVSTGAGPEYLLPGWLPAGLEPASVTDIPDAAELGFGGDVAVYGNPDTDDPWSTTLVVTHLVADEELLGGAPSNGEAVTVAGHPARLHDEFEDGRRWQVEWQVDDGLMIVGGALTRDEVLAAAETATAEPAIGASGLPDGYVELARGPNAAADFLLTTSLFEGNVDGSLEGSTAGSVDGAANGAGLAVTYADPADRDAVRTALVVAQRPGPASAVDLLRLWFADADATTVRDRPAVIGRGRELPGSAGEAGVVAVQWAEPEGRLVTVVGFGVAEDVTLQVAQSLRPGGTDEVAALREQHPVAAPRELGEVPEEHVVVASGESRTGQWRIVADAGRQENVGALTLERVWGAIAGTSSTTGDRFEPPLDLAADLSDGTVVVWGVLGVDAASVTVESPGVEPVALPVHEVEGWSHLVVAGSFPMDHFGVPSGEVSVVARDAGGREVARNSTVLAS